MVSPAEANVKRQFSTYGPVAEVKVHRKGAYGFVRYENHEDAVRAIVCMNGQVGGYVSLAALAGVGYWLVGSLPACLPACLPAGAGRRLSAALRFAMRWCKC
jgi:hypothetical protein